MRIWDKDLGLYVPVTTILTCICPNNKWFYVLPHCRLLVSHSVFFKQEFIDNFTKVHKLSESLKVLKFDFDGLN